ncbi:MAG TPA: hypothetical protein VNP95_04795 [Thermomicrobiales bacterium]|nr:hypothetical protein [Thermomicrobiales bacterium]
MTTTTTHPIDRQATVTSDLCVYGAYAPHLRYRQERIAQAAIITNISRPGRSPSRLETIRERVGMALIAWGTRLEGQHPCPPASVATR